MDEKNEPKKLTPPYISFKTFLNFLDQLKVGIPHRIDRTVMGKFSGTARTQILTTLKYLQLINPDDTSTEKLQKLVTADGINKNSLKEIIIAAYPFIFENGVELSRMSLGHLKDLFEKAGASGGTTRKSIAFFVAAAKEIGLELYPRLKMTGLSRGVVKKAKKSGLEKTGADDGELKQPTRRTSLEEIQLWLSVFPKFDPSWSDEIKKSWFEGFRDLRKDFKQESDKGKEESQ